MKFLFFALFLPFCGYAQSNESRLLFLTINGKRTEMKYPSLSYMSDKQTELDTRVVKIGIDDNAVAKESCDCSSETVFSAESFKELLQAAIDNTKTWYHLDSKERNAAVSVVSMDGKYYAVIRTY